MQNSIAAKLASCALVVSSFGTGCSIHREQPSLFRLPPVPRVKTGVGATAVDSMDQISIRLANEYEVADVYARLNDIDNFIYLDTHGAVSHTFRKVQSISGPLGRPGEWLNVIGHGNRELSFSSDLFDEWKSSAVTALGQSNIRGVLIQFDGTVIDPNFPSKQYPSVTPFSIGTELQPL